MKVDNNLKAALQNILLLTATCFLILVAVEIFLQIFQPFEYRVKGNKIILPVRKTYVFDNNKTDKLDRTVIHTKNSLGFRGDDPPDDLEKLLSIITVGGSTTDCLLISNGKTWTDILGEKLKNNFSNIWINNAGLDGQSTFGHIVLMEDYVKKIKPKVVIFLIGANDKWERGKPNRFDKRMLYQGYDSRTVRGVLQRLTYHSEVFSAADNIFRYLKARNMGLVHRIVDFKALDYLDIPELEMEKRVKKIREDGYEGFKGRIEKIIQLSRENGIDPVIMTQPTLNGHVIDDVTGVDLARVRPTKKGKVNGAIVWERYKRVNDVTRKTAGDNDVFVIDLAKELPKSTKYYYDFLHYSNEGNRKVAEIIYDKLCPFLEERFGEHLKNSCQ